MWLSKSTSTINSRMQQTPKPSAHVPEAVPPLLSHSSLQIYRFHIMVNPSKMLKEKNIYAVKHVPLYAVVVPEQTSLGNLTTWKTGTENKC